MGADAILWIAVGPLLFLGCAFVCAFALAQRVLRGGGEVEVEVRAPSLSFHVRAAGESLPRNTTNGAGTSDPRGRARDPRPPDGPSGGSPQTCD